MRYTHTTFLDVFNDQGGRRRLPPCYVLALLFFLTNFFLSFKLVIAEPYIPESKKMVLDYLPEKLTVLSNKTQQLEEKLKKNGRTETRENLQEKLIRAYLSEAKISGDMRYVSYAKNRLNQWLQVVPTSEKARLLGAKIKQYNHEFKAAIIQLKNLLNEYPENNEAWSLLSNIHLLMGDYSKAKASCRQLSVTSSLVGMIICQSNIMIRTGELDKANKVLDVLLLSIENMPIMQKLWLYTSLAEIKMQQGKAESASLFFSKAMYLAEDNNMKDSYLLRIFIDYLIQNKKFEKAFELIKYERNDSALMIRATLLAKKLGHDVLFRKNEIALTQMFNVEKRRGTARHLREHALFALLILGKPNEALMLARKNWSLQKEPEDARILMKSALLSGDAEQLRWVKASINKTGMVDHRLHENVLIESLL